VDGGAEDRFSRREPGIAVVPRRAQRHRARSFVAEGGRREAARAAPGVFRGALGRWRELYTFLSHSGGKASARLCLDHFAKMAASGWPDRARLPAGLRNLLDAGQMNNEITTGLRDHTRCTVYRIVSNVMQY
jgi:hypothetical protein